MHYISLHPANVCQLRPYLLVIGKPWQLNTAKENSSMPACTALPFKDKEGAISSPRDAKVVVQKCDILGFTTD